MVGSIFPQPCQHIIIIIFIRSILRNVRWYLTLVFICVSLRISDFEHLFMYLCEFVCLLWEISIHIICLFKIGLFIIEEFHIFWMLTPCHIYSLQIFFPILQLTFSFCWLFLFCCAIDIYFNVSLVYFCFHCLWFWCHIQESITKINVK